MEVSTWFGSKTYGVRIGAANRDRYFVRTWSEIEVELDGQVHTFSLTNGFWHKCPEFRDRGEPVIKKWLQRNRSLEWPRGHPPRMSLIPLGGNRFRLLA
jgi:hypothetical protein